VLLTSFLPGAYFAKICKESAIFSGEGAWTLGEDVMKADHLLILTLDELAAYLKIGKRTLYGLAAKGEIPAFKVGGVWRFRRSEIDQWIADQTQVSTKKEVMRKREQQRSAEQDLSQPRNVRRSRRTS
jgi:excisionase family DNA binding protein